MRLLILGCGDIGTRVGLAFIEAGWAVIAARRSPERLPAAFTRVRVDMTEPQSLVPLGEHQPDYVLVTPTPPSYDAAGYQAGFLAAAQHLAAQSWLKHCRRVIWVSSTRVYREAAGGWVDEHAPLNTEEPQAGFMVRAEACIRRAAVATVMRPAGVYGNPDGMLVRKVLSGRGGVPGAVFGNRIHRHDLSRLIGHCLLRDSQGEWVPPTILACDNDVTPTYEIERWLAQQWGVALIEEGAGGRPRANRRCRSRLLSALGFELTYPTWREGYAEVVSARQSAK